MDEVLALQVAIEADGPEPTMFTTCSGISILCSTETN